jgi:hypothetical protein
MDWNFAVTMGRRMYVRIARQVLPPGQRMKDYDSPIKDMGHHRIIRMLTQHAASQLC